MSTLTPTQLADFRQWAGDDGSSPEINDTQIQADYDKASALSSDAVTVEATTMVFILRRLMGLARKKIDVRGEVEAETRSQLFEHIRDELLPYWSGLAGMNIKGGLSAGVLSLGIDMTDDDVTAGTVL